MLNSISKDPYLSKIKKRKENYRKQISAEYYHFYIKHIQICQTF